MTNLSSYCCLNVDDVVVVDERRRICLRADLLHPAPHRSLLHMKGAQVLRGNYL